MLKKFLVGLVVVILVFVLIVALQPSAYTVERSTTIEAPAAEVYPIVNDFHKWQHWSPWAKLDPNSKITFSGEESGKGAIFAWDGNEDVGAGQMTITESQPHELVRIHLEFTRPFADQCTTQFALAPSDGGTELTWTMTGENNFVGKMFCLFMNLDEMVGKDYEKGLANIKSLVESSTAAEASVPDPRPAHVFDKTTPKTIARDVPSEGTQQP